MCLTCGHHNFTVAWGYNIIPHSFNACLVARFQIELRDETHHVL